MKQLIIPILWCVIAGTAFCQEKGATVILDTAPLKTDSLEVLHEDSYYKIVPDDDGKCRIHFNSGNFPKDVRFQIYNLRLKLVISLERGDSLYITDALQKRVFAGRGAANAQVFDHLFKHLADEWNTLDIEVVKTGTPTDLYNRFNSIFKYAFDYLEKHKKEITPSFYNYLYTCHYYRALNFLIDVPRFYMLWSGKSLSQSIPDHYWDLEKYILKHKAVKNGKPIKMGEWSYVKSINPRIIAMNDALLTNEEYRTCMCLSLTEFFEYQYKFSTNKPDSAFSDQELFQTVHHRIEKEHTGKTRSKALLFHLSNEITKSKNASELKPVLDDYFEKYSGLEDAEELKKLQHTYEVAVNTAVGKVPAPLTLKDINGNDVSLSDFAGKVVYLDFWASWCSPCRAQMEKGAPKLHEMFKDKKDLVFLYINMDDKPELGRKAIDEDKIEGIHLFSGGFKSDNAVVQAFNIQGIPRYIVIGKDGKIFDNDAPRPTEDDAQKVLKAALSAM